MVSGTVCHKAASTWYSICFVLFLPTPSSLPALRLFFYSSLTRTNAFPIRRGASNGPTSPPAYWPNWLLTVMAAGDIAGNNADRWNTKRGESALGAQHLDGRL